MTILKFLRADVIFVTEVNGYSTTMIKVGPADNKQHHILIGRKISIGIGTVCYKNRKVSCVCSFCQRFQRREMRNAPLGIPIMTSKIAENEYCKRKKSGTEQRFFSLAICPQKTRVYGNTKREMYWPDFFAGEIA